MLQHALNRLSANSRSRLIFRDQVFTTSQLAARTQMFIAELKAMAPGARPFALYLPNSPELLCWQVACFDLGIPIVPIIYAEDQDFVVKVMELTRPAYLLTTSGKAAMLPPLPCQIKIIDDTHQAIVVSQTTTQIEPSGANARALAMVIFSSGTTGQVKGIAHSYESAYGFMLTLKDHLQIS